MWVACQASRAECLTTAGPSFRHTGISSYPPDCMGFPQPGNRFPPFRWPSQEGLTMDLSTLQSCKAMSARFPFRRRRTRSRSFMNRIVSPAHSRHSPHPPVNRRPADRLSQDEVRRIIGAVGEGWISWCQKHRHPCESRDPERRTVAISMPAICAAWMPAAGWRRACRWTRCNWVPAFAGMTIKIRLEKG